LPSTLLLLLLLLLLLDLPRSLTIHLQPHRTHGDYKVDNLAIISTLNGNLLQVPPEPGPVDASKNDRTILKSCGASSHPPTKKKFPENRPG
jgi:hypothetical protein